MRDRRIARAAPVLLALAGCSPSDRDWHGFVLGRAPTIAATADPLDANAHVVLRPDSPGFPWQTAKARLDRAGAVMAVTLQTDCCAMALESDRSPTPEEVAETARQERAVPDRFRQQSPPPSVRDVDWTRQPRTISLRDMDGYAAAAMADAVRTLGPATMQRRERVFSLTGSDISAIEDPVAFRAIWKRNSKVVALFDANHESICLSVVSPDVPHPPLDTACGGVRMDCPASWYPDDRPAGGTLSGAITPPPIVRAPGAPKPACRPD